MILGLHVTSSFGKIENLRATKVITFLRHEGRVGGKFIYVNNVSAQVHALSKDRHILNFRVMAVRDIML